MEETDRQDSGTGLTETTQVKPQAGQCPEPQVLLDLGVVGGGPPGRLLQPLVLLVAAVVLLDEDGRPPALLETLLLVVRPELGLDQDGRLGHLFVESVLKKKKSVCGGKSHC